MKKILISVITTMLLFGVVACQKQVAQKEEQPKTQQDTPSQVAYKFLKAYMQSDYEEEQKYLYAEGSYEVDKGVKKQSILFDSNDISGLKEYHDKENQVVFVWIEYKNPHSSTRSTDTKVYAIRKDGKGNFKVDMDASFDFSSIQQRIKPKVINPKSLGV